MWKVVITLSHLPVTSGDSCSRRTPNPCAGIFDKPNPWDSYHIEPYAFYIRYKPGSCAIFWGYVYLVASHPPVQQHPAAEKSRIDRHWLRIECDFASLSPTECIIVKHSSLGQRNCALFTEPKMVSVLRGSEGLLRRGPKYNQWRCRR